MIKFPVFKKSFVIFKYQFLFPANTCLDENVFKTSSRCLSSSPSEDVFKTS